MTNADIGLIGLAVMGANLARNIASRGHNVLVYNRTYETTQTFIANFGGANLQGSENIENFVKGIKRPRHIIVMVKAGEGVDAVIAQLIPLLEEGDTIIDCGNSYFLDTIRRYEELKVKGINFVGCGVSGGEEGALNGPSIMPGGDIDSYERLKPVLESIAAKDFSGKPCVSYMGQNGAGHYVKMVHNGIEYGVMQIMAEAYELLRSVYGLSPVEISTIFERFNKGKLNSYLFEIAVHILRQKDEFHPDGYLIDYILDKAEQKGTGKWTGKDSLDRGITLSTITEAVYARTVSAQKKLREKLISLSKKPAQEKKSISEAEVHTLEQALYNAMLTCYAQGFDLIHAAAREQGWDINLPEIARIWEGGCIIRAKILNELHAAFSDKNYASSHLYEIPVISEAMSGTIEDLRTIVKFSVEHAIPAPCLTSALVYFDSITRAQTSANFIQGLRDYFGAHTYERTDREGIFHTKWSN